MPYLYYNPEKWGLTPVAEFDLYEPDYSFDLIAVWQDDEGNVWAAHDSGCSCPVPFEDHTFPTDFMLVHDWQDVKTLIEQNRYEGYRRPNPIDSNFRLRVQRALKGPITTPAGVLR